MTIGHIQHVLPGLFIGDLHAARNLKVLTKLRISHIVNLSGHEPSFPDQFFYQNINIADSPKTNIKRYFTVTNWLIQGALKGGNNVLVHCAAGISRSATIVLAYILFRNTSWTVNRALTFLISKRSIVHPNEGFMKQLIDWHDSVNKPAKRVSPGKQKPSSRSPIRPGVGRSPARPRGSKTR